MVNKNLLQAQGAENRRRPVHDAADHSRVCARTVKSQRGGRVHEACARSLLRRARLKRARRKLAEEDRANWLAVWDAEHDNLRDALDWLIGTESGQWALRLGTALFAFWERREHIAEGRERLEAVLNMKSAASPTGERARAAWYAAIFADQQGISDAPSGSITRACTSIANLAIAKASPFSSVIWGTRCVRPVTWQKRGRSSSNRSAAFRQLGDGTALARALSNFAEFVIAQGEYALGSSLLEEALSIFRELGNASGVGWSLNHLGDVAFEENDFVMPLVFTTQGTMSSRAWEITGGSQGH